MVSARTWYATAPYVAASLGLGLAALELSLFFDAGDFSGGRFAALGARLMVGSALAWTLYLVRRRRDRRQLERNEVRRGGSPTSGG